MCLGSQAVARWSFRARFGVWTRVDTNLQSSYPLWVTRGAEWLTSLDISRIDTLLRSDVMDIGYCNVAGLDVHSKTVVCAIRCCQSCGKCLKQVRSFGTMTRDLRALAGYLQSHEITHLAMEATRVYWKPCGTSSRPTLRYCWSIRGISRKSPDAKRMSAMPNG